MFFSIHNFALKNCVYLDLISFIYRILVDNVEGLRDIQVVPGKRMPLVRFKNQTGEIKCDLSMNNK